MKELYDRNRDFREYVDRYCEAHKITRDVALTHSIVRCIALIHETKTKKHGGA